MEREIIKIDEDKCDGCGLCIPGCPEGALQIIDDKVRLVSEVEVGVGNAGNQFDGDGKLTDERLAGALASQMQALRAVALADGA